MVLALAAVTMPLDLLRLTVLVAAVLVLYVGVVVCLRAAGLLVTDHSIPRLHKREVFGVFAAMVVAAGADRVRRRRHRRPEHQRTPGEPEQPGLQRLHRAVRATAQPDRVARQPQRDVVGGVQLPRRRAHHHDPRAAQRRRPLPDARRLLRLRRQRSRAHEPRRRRQPRPAAQGARRRGGARARPARRPHRRGRHVGQEAGHLLLPRLLRARRDLGGAGVPRHRRRSSTATSPTSSSSTSRTTCSRRTSSRRSIDNGLWDRVWKPNPKQIGWPTLYDMVATKTKAQEKVGERPRRLVVMSEKHPGVYPWLLGAYDVAQESPYTFTSTSQFNCNPNRGGKDKAFFILNHWLRPNGPPDPVAAAKVNSQKVLTARMQDCIAKRGQLPNALAVDFTSQGDLQKTVRTVQRGGRPPVGRHRDRGRDRAPVAGERPGDRQPSSTRCGDCPRSPRRRRGSCSDRSPTRSTTPAALLEFADPCPAGTHPRHARKCQGSQEPQEARGCQHDDVVHHDHGRARHDRPRRRPRRRGRRRCRHADVDTPAPAVVPEGCVAL